MSQPQLRIALIAFLIFFNSSSVGSSLELPKYFQDLGSSKFQVRESAQAELLAWARQRPKQAMVEFFTQSRIAMDPEVRERCIQILKGLVGDEYLKEGEGYIGIALGLNDETLTLPGDSTPRKAIRVTEVRADTPGQLAGVQFNDLIVALGGITWRGVEATPLFRERIRAMKPESDAKLTILRDGKLVALKVKLGRRPLMADMFFNGLNFDPDAAERAAKEAYFSRRLMQMKAEK